MAKAINAREWRVIGLSRSGNHAILQWLIAQLPGAYTFLNCAEGQHNPYATVRPMDDGCCHRTNIRGYDFQAEAAGRFTPKDTLIFSHEDSFLRRACSDVFERHHDEWVGRSAQRFDILILRDPYNLFASRLRNPTGLVRPRSAMRIWKQHARQAINGGRMLRHNPVIIAYNRWFRDENYRRHIAEQLGLDFTDAGRLEVAACNGGSSFDGMTYRHHADRMRVLQRWEHYVGDRRYTALFDDDVVNLARRVFGADAMAQPEHALRQTGDELLVDA